MPGRESTSNRPELFELFSWVPGAAAAIVVLVAQLFGRAGISGFAWVTAVSVAVFLVGALGAQRFGALPLVPRPTKRDAFVLAAYATVAGLLFLGPLRGSNFAPLTFSVDAAHHGAAIEWMTSAKIIPSGPVPTLGGQAGYPFGSYTLASLVAWAAHLSPYRTMWLLSIALVISCWMICASLVEVSIGPTARAFALVPVPLALAAWRFTLGMVTRDFFYAQLVGIWLSLSSVAGIAWWSARHARLGATACLAVLGSIACLFTYPQVAPIPLAALTFEVLRAKFNKRALMILVAVGGAGVVSAAFFVRMFGINRAALAGVGEGERAPVTIAAAGGLFTIWLLSVGLMELLVRKRGRVGIGAIVGGASAPLLVAAGLAALRLPMFGSLPVTGYRIEKNLYALAPFAIVVASIGVVSSVGEFRRILDLTRSWQTAVVAALGLVVASASLLGPTSRTLSTRPVITQDEYQAMTWATRRWPAEEIGMSFRDFGAYHLWWLKSGRPADEVNSSMGAPLRMTRWDGWPDDSPEKYLVTSGWLAKKYRSIPGVTVKFSSGDAFVLERPSE